MPAILASLLGRALPYPIVGAAAIGIFLYVQHLRKENADLRNVKAALETQLDQAQAVNAENVAALARLKAAGALALAAASAERDQAVKEKADLAALLGRIQASKDVAGRDAPAAPVLRDALAGLRATSAPPPGKGKKP